MGTHGIGKGLDDKNLIPLYEEIAKNNLFIFIHPHYGIGNEYYSGFGHSLFLALGFTFETSVSISRLILSGILDIVPKLKLLLAHSGGTLPFLGGRLDSCVQSEIELSNKLKKKPTEYLKQLYYDGLTYEINSLKCTLDLVGENHIFFGTDHPFFPPHYLNSTGIEMDSVVWPSTAKNQETILKLDSRISQKILRNNAINIFGLKDCEKSLFPRVKTYHIQRWLDKKYTKMGWSTFKIGSRGKGEAQFLGQHAFDFFNGEKMDRCSPLLFAGDYIEFCCVGTAHGSFVSGQNSARAIIDSEQKTLKKQTVL